MTFLEGARVKRGIPTVELWRCPKCGREFARHNQGHSCVSTSVDDHFRGKAYGLRVAF